MLNYTTTTIVNDGTTIQNGTDWFRVNYGPKLFKDANHTPKVIAKTAYVAPVNAKATVTIPATSSTEAIYRIAMYIRLRNNNNPYFSNEWVYKGKPLYIEFTNTDTATTIVTRAKKYMLAQYGYNLVEFAATNATTLTITAHDQWEMFMTQDNTDGVIVEKLYTVDMAGNIITTGTTANSPTHEEFKYDSSITVTIDKGNEGFGDFAHVVKDLRLPTAANLRWNGIAQGDIFGNEPNDDRPLPTGKYTQYTIQYDAERGIGQQTVLGGVGTSRTVHVFFVESAAVAAMDAALIAAGIVTDSDNNSTVDSAELATPEEV